MNVSPNTSLFNGATMNVNSLFAALSCDIAACYLPAFGDRAKDRETRAMLKVLRLPDWRNLPAAEVIDRLPQWGADVAFWGIKRDAAVSKPGRKKIPSIVTNTKRFENAAAWVASNGGAEAKRRIGYPQRLICDLHEVRMRLQQGTESPALGIVLDTLLANADYQALLAET